jgi:phosphotransferase system HPr-like phosphotransfer protein
MFSIHTHECSNAQLAHLVAQQQAFTEEAQSERHNKTNNPVKGIGNSSMKVLLLNIVLNGELELSAELEESASGGDSTIKHWMQIHRYRRTVSGQSLDEQRPQLIRISNAWLGASIIAIYALF